MLGDPYLRTVHCAGARASEPKTSSSADVLLPGSSSPRRSVLPVVSHSPRRGLGDVTRPCSKWTIGTSASEGGSSPRFLCCLLALGECRSRLGVKRSLERRSSCLFPWKAPRPRRRLPIVPGGCECPLSLGDLECRLRGNALSRQAGRFPLAYNPRENDCSHRPAASIRRWVGEPSGPKRATIGSHSRP
jgi:hypothetical protein